MQIIPLNPVPNQTLNIQLGGQDCDLNVTQSFFGVFVDVYVSNAPIIVGVLCENRNRIVRSAYLGFIGDLAFVDTQGSDNPFYTGLGVRFQLLYLEPADLT